MSNYNQEKYLMHHRRNCSLCGEEHLAEEMRNQARPGGAIWVCKKCGLDNADAMRYNKNVDAGTTEPAIAYRQMFPLTIKRVLRKFRRCFS